jgi:predicted HicB family RNase H-like nuclease
LHGLWGFKRGDDMKDMMSYKKYYGSVHYNDDDQIFHGKVEFIRALINYEGEDVKGLRKAFEEAVTDYLVPERKGCQAMVIGYL